MIGILEWEMRAANTTLDVLAGNFSNDDQNIPAIAGSIVVPFNADVLAALDPRKTAVPRVTLTGTFSEWGSLPISDMTAYATSEGGTIADLTAAWTGDTLSDVSALFGSALSESASTETQTMSLDLHVREIAYDNFEMTISLASDEALLQDWAATSSSDTDAFLEIRSGMDEQKIAAWVDPVLKVILGYGLTPTVYTTQALSVPWTDIHTPIRETTAWEYMRPFLDDTNLKLRVNPSGHGFTLQRPEESLTGNSHVFTDLDVISVKHVYSRTGDWYDSVELHRPTSEGDSAGFPVIPAGYFFPHSRTYLEDWTGRKPSTSMAYNIYKRTINRGRFIDIEAPIRLNVFMRDAFTYIQSSEQRRLDLRTAGSRATTPDTALLDITGDIDIRWTGERPKWRKGLPADLISKYAATGNQRSWLLRAEYDGTLTLFWSNNGTAVLEARSIAKIPDGLKHIRVRATLDVNNGAGGRTVRFYYSPVGGAWRQLGNDVVAAGTTSIFNSTAVVTVGRNPESVANDTPQFVDSFEIRSGINGTVRASADFNAMTTGGTSFTDSHGRTWTVTGGSVTDTIATENWIVKAVSYDLTSGTMHVRGELPY